MTTAGWWFHRWLCGGFPKTRLEAFVPALLVVSLVTLPTLPGVATAQDSPLARPFSGPSVEVPLVELAVTVTDADGRPTLDLGAEDFRVLQDGQPLPLAGFSPPTGIHSEGQTPPTLRLVLVIHDQFLEAGDLRALAPALEAFLRHHLPAGTPLLPLRVSPGLTWGDGFTADPQAALESLERLEALDTRSGGSRLAEGARTLMRDIRRQAARPADDTPGVPDAVPRLLLARISAFAEEARRETAAAMAALGQVVTAVEGLPGRTEMVLVSGRLPSGVGQELYSEWRRAFGPSSRYWGRDNLADAGIDFDRLPDGMATLELGELLQALGARAAAAGIPVHTVDASAGRMEGRVGRGESGRRQSRERRLLERLARVTGGRALLAEPAAGLESLGRQLGSYYRLAIEPPTGADGEVHAVTVELNDELKGEELDGARSLAVRHPALYRATGRDHRASRAAVSALLLGQESNPLEVSLEAAEDALAVRVPLERLALVADGHRHRGQLALFTAWRGSEGDGSGIQVAKSVVPVSIANDELLTAQGRAVEYRLEPPATAGPLALVVRDDFEGTWTVLVARSDG